MPVICLFVLLINKCNESEVYSLNYAEQGMYSEIHDKDTSCRTAPRIFLLFLSNF